MSDAEKRQWLAKDSKDFVTSSKAFADVGENYQRLMKATQGELGVDDVATVYSFIKMMDANAVREGEIQMFLDTTPLGDKVKMWATMDKARFGKFLSPDMIKEIRSLATEFYNFSKDRHTRSRESAIGRAKSTVGDGYDLDVYYPTYDVSIDQGGDAEIKTNPDTGTQYRKNQQGLWEKI